MSFDDRDRLLGADADAGAGETAPAVGGDVYAAFGAAVAAGGADGQWHFGAFVGSHGAVEILGQRHGFVGLILAVEPEKRHKPVLYHGAVVVDAAAGGNIVARPYLCREAVDIVAQSTLPEFADHADHQFATHAFGAVAHVICLPLLRRWRPPAGKLFQEWRWQEVRRLS
ncbi:hypothetical protein SDC9_166948 [bioreactor metagenome]|uniref:Uncharacterized protein n=1 Tax=bioreactor metagenome TaxID=1076179 RepID=A0A645FYF5_9ZZZZ